MSVHIAHTVTTNSVTFSSLDHFAGPLGTARTEPGLFKFIDVMIIMIITIAVITFTITITDGREVAVRCPSDAGPGDRLAIDVPEASRASRADHADDVALVGLE